MEYEHTMGDIRFNVKKHTDISKLLLKVQKDLNANITDGSVELKVSGYLRPTGEDLKDMVYTAELKEGPISYFENLLNDGWDLSVRGFAGRIGFSQEDQRTQTAIVFNGEIELIAENRIQPWNLEKVLETIKEGKETKQLIGKLEEHYHIRVSPRLLVQASGPVQKLEGVKEKYEKLKSTLKSYDEEISIVKKWLRTVRDC